MKAKFTSPQTKIGGTREIMKELFKCAKNNDMKKADMLLFNPNDKNTTTVDVNERLSGYHMRTPIFEAAFFNQIGMAKLLIEQGSKVNCIDKFYRTPLHISAINRGLEMTKLLVQAKADVFAEDKYKRRAIDIATRPTCV